MKILVVLPVTGLSTSAVETRRRHLLDVASPETRLDVAALKDGPASIESALDEYYAAPELIAKAKEAEEKGYDGVVNHCFGDPGIHAARETVRIPVVGAGESAMALASILGDSFSVVTILKETIPAIKRLARLTGVEEKLASVRAVDIPALQLYNDPAASKKAFLKQAWRTIEHDDADVVVPGCGGFSVWANELSRELNVPVVDPGGTALKIAEALVRLRISHSVRSYPRPTEKTRTLPKLSPLGGR